MSLIGTLSEIKLADVLRLFAAGRKTGVLTASAPGRQALMRLHRGAIVHAAAARLQGDDAVLDVFGWTDGQLTFVPEDKTVTPNVTHGMDVLILEGERLGPTFHRMNELIPTDSVSFQMAAPPDEAQVTVTGAQWRVLRYVDSVRDVREVIEVSELPRAQVVRALFELHEAGFVERVDLQKRLRVQGTRAFSSFSLLGPDGRSAEGIELDERYLEDWRKAPRFRKGVDRVELRTLGYKKSALVAPQFRAGVGKEVHLPRPLLQELHAREGDDLLVRPWS